MTIEERLAEVQKKYQRAKTVSREIQAINHVEQRKLYDEAYGVRIERADTL